MRKESNSKNNFPLVKSALSAALILLLSSCSKNDSESLVTLDRDGDGVEDSIDAFPDNYNESIDTDKDGVGDNTDAFPNDATETLDFDKDGVGDTADLDDDNDGMPDLFESEFNLDLTIDDSLSDSDADLLSNIDEYKLGTSPVAFNPQVSGYSQTDILLSSAIISIVDARSTAVTLKNNLARTGTARSAQTDVDGNFNIVLPSDALVYPLLVSAVAPDNSLTLHSIISTPEQSSLSITGVTTILLERVLSRSVNASFEERFVSTVNGQISNIEARINNELTEFAGDIHHLIDSSTDNLSFTSIFTQSENEKSLLKSDSFVNAMNQQIALLSDHSGSVSGVVTEQGSNQPLAQIEVFVEGQLAAARTDVNGAFTLENLPLEQRLSVSFDSKNHAINQKIITLDAIENEESRTLISVSMKAVSERINFSDVLAQGASASEDKEGAISVATADKSVSIKIPSSFLNQVISANQGRIAANSNLTDLTLDITKIDPTSERDVFPGNFEAREVLPSEANSASEEGSITLESVVLSDFTLRDGEGNVLEMPEGESMVVRMEVPDGLQEQYKALFDSGTRTIPWWSYNEARGEWIKESESTLLDVDGTLFAEATITHFSWWNVDQPIATHALVCGLVKGQDGNALSGVSITTKGISYNGNGSATTDSEGKYQVRVKKLSEIEVIAAHGGIEDKLSVSVENLPVSECQVQADLTLAIYQISGTITNNAGDSLAGVKVVANNGTSTYSDENGGYSLAVNGSETFTVTASIYKDDLKHTATVSVVVVEDDIEQNISLSTEPVMLTGTVMVENDGVQSALAGVLVSSENGQESLSAELGEFSLVLPSSDEEQEHSIKFRATLPSGLVQEKEFSVNVSNSDLTMGEIVFVDSASFIKGKVINPNGEPMKGVDVSTNLSTSTKTGVNGFFELEVPVGAEVVVTAYYVDPILNVNESVSSLATIIPEDSDTISIPFLKFEKILPAYIEGEVREQDTTKLLPGVTVSTEFGAKTITDKLGRYKLKAPVNATVKLFYSFDYLDNSDESARFGSGDDVVDTGAVSSKTEKPLLLDLESNPASITQIEVSPQVTTPGDDIVISVYAKDPDGDPLAFVIGDVAADAISQEVLADGTVRGYTTITAQQEFGTQSIAVSVAEDNDDPSPAAKRNVQVIVKENSVPVILELTADKLIYAPFETVTLTGQAFDSDGDGLSFQWNDGLGNDESMVTNDASSYVFSIPEGTADGEYFAELTVKDDKHEANFNNKTIGYFVQSNRAPDITGITTSPSSTVAKGAEVTFNSIVTDPDGESLTYSWTDSDGTVLSTERRFKFTAPEFNEDTTITFTFSATDGEKSSSQAVSIVVKAYVITGPGTEPGTEPVVDPIEDASLNGFVTDPIGNPIVGALIELYNQDRSVDIQTTSDITGYYQFGNIVTGSYFIAVTRDGFTISSATVKITE